MSFKQQQKDVYWVEQMFERKLIENLNLIKVKAPLFFECGTGEQDGLSGFEKSVSFISKSNGKKYEVVHSLAKWKRALLSENDFVDGEGVVANMKAIRAHEDEITEIHSMYVDQWDWECVLDSEKRNTFYLKHYVDLIYSALLETVNEIRLQKGEPDFLSFLPSEIKYIYSEELLKMYPDLSSKEREHKIAKEYGAVFIIGIGADLSNGHPHDVRAADYDDWTTINNNGFKGLNGDLIVWCPSINRSLELSSMGIRVDKSALIRQTALKNEIEKLVFPWHKKLLNGGFKQTIGGGIGKSRMIMFLNQYSDIHCFKF